VTIPEFLKYVKNTIRDTQNDYTTYFWYHSNEISKPYFDIDYKDEENLKYNVEISNELIEKVENLLRCEFNDCEIIRTENHRYKEEKEKNGEIKKFYKYSFHFYLNNYKAYPREIKLWINQISEEEEGYFRGKKIFDPAPYSSTKGKFRFCYGKKGAKDKYFPVLSHPYKIKDYLLFNVKEEAYEYSYKNTIINDEDNKLTEKKKQENEKRKAIYASAKMMEFKGDVTYDNYEMNEKQKEIIKKILDLLDIEYCEEYGKWFRICSALKLYSNTEDMFNIFNEFSKRSEKNYDYDSCEVTWKKCRADKVTIKTIILYLEKSEDKYFKEGEIEKMGNIQELKKDLNLLTKEIESESGVRQYITDDLKYVDRIENVETVNFDNIFINYEKIWHEFAHIRELGPCC
jgi:hypothetical protein